MSYLVLARKWRPTGFDDLVGQETITQILKNAILQGKIAHAYLFSGPRGVGKTSTARILAKALNCKEGPTPVPCGKCASCTAITEGSSVDVIEIDGASNNSVDDIRDLRERVKYAPSGGKYKVYIIDEVHMLSTSAFNALLKTLEEPPSHVIFVLATTEMKKIPATVLSRCQHMPFRRIKSSSIKARLNHISESEGIKVSPAALSLIVRAADGSMRDSLTILDQLFSFANDITEEQVKNLLSIADFDLLLKISKALISGNRADILKIINTLSEYGTDMRSFTKELVQFFRDLLVASVMKNPEDVLDASTEELSLIKEMLSSATEDQLTLMLAEIMKAETDVRNSSFPRLALEMSLIKASFLSSMRPVKDIIENIDKYSRQTRAVNETPPAIQEDIKEQAKPLSDENEEAEKTVAPSREISGSTEEGVLMSRDSQKGMKVNNPPLHPCLPDRQASPEGTFETGDGDKIMQEPLTDNKDDIERSWKRTLERIDAPLASKLSQTVIELKGSELFLTLNGGHAVFEDSISKNKKMIEKILAEESGSAIRIRLTTAHKKSPRKKDLKEKALEDPVIKEALELFEGRIVDVMPVENSEHINNGGKNV